MDKHAFHLFKTLAYQVQAYLHWFNEFQSEGEWSAIINQTNYREALEDLLPQCLDCINSSKQDQP